MIGHHFRDNMGRTHVQLQPLSKRQARIIAATLGLRTLATVGTGTTPPRPVARFNALAVADRPVAKSTMRWGAT